MIGIVSGAGPLAGLDVARKIIEETVAETDQEHLPVLVFSVPEDIPDRSRFLLSQSADNPGGAIGEIFHRLELAGATVAAIACNTAHATPIFQEVENHLTNHNSQLQVIHLIDLTVRAIQGRFDTSMGAIGVMGTDGTMQQKLYSKPLEQVGYQVLTPNADEQGHVHGSVFRVKAQSSPVDPQAVRDLEVVMDSLIERGAKALLLGCTELPLAITATQHRGIPLIDPNRLLAQELIRQYAPAKLRSAVL